MDCLLNPSAGGGGALSRWRRIEPALRQRFGDFPVHIARDADDARRWVGEMLRAGRRDLVAAGGDGTVNLIIQSVLDAAGPEALRTLRLGAIGLGWSNDFQKPLRSENRIAGVPCRLGFASTVLHDVGVLRYEDPQGSEQTRHWILHASVGVTAEASLLFRRGVELLPALKRPSPFRGMVWATLRAIAAQQSRGMRVQTDGTRTGHCWVTNLGIVKNPHFTGCLRYDSPYEPGSGSFHVHLCERMSRAETLITLVRLARGRFAGLPWARSWRADHLILEADAPFALEYDGEVVRARRAEFTLRARALSVCR